jgi:hypothetical protein
MFYSHFFTSRDGLCLQKHRNYIWLIAQITNLQNLSLIRGQPHKRSIVHMDDTVTAKNKYN